MRMTPRATLQPPSPLLVTMGQVRDEHPTVLCGRQRGQQPWSCGTRRGCCTDTEYLQGKPGFPLGSQVILDLWIQKAVLEHFSPLLIAFRRLLSGFLPLGSFTNIPA